MYSLEQLRAAFDAGCNTVNEPRISSDEAFRVFFLTLGPKPETVLPVSSDPLSKLSGGVESSPAVSDAITD